MFGKKTAATEPLSHDGYPLSSITTCGTCRAVYSAAKYPSCPCCADWNSQTKSSS